MLFDVTVNIQLNLMGHFRLLVNGEDVAVKARKSKALLAWLALHQGKPQSREKLAALLWSESAPQQARQSLRQTLTDIRRILTDCADALEVSSDRVLFSDGALNVDVIQFEGLAESSDEAGLERAADLYQGTLMDGLDARSESFDIWLSAEQIRLLDMAISALSRLVDHFRHVDIERAISFGQRLLSIDPLQERMHRRLMELYHAIDRREEVVRQYRDFRNLLQKELGLLPGAETDALYNQLLRRPEIVVKETPVSIRRTSEAQLRQITAIAVNLANLGDFADDEERFAEVRNDAVRVITNITEKLGGEIGNSSNEVVLASFGLNPGRRNSIDVAVEAAIQIRDWFTTEPLNIKCALMSGQVILNDQGKAQGALQSQVSELARLAGFGQIISPLALVSSIAHKVSFSTLEADFQGRVIASIEAFADELEKTPFAGRYLQIQQLKLAMDTCRETGCGQTILVRGEAGIGKTRLVEELIKRISSEGVVVGAANLSDHVNDSVSNLTRLVTSILSFDINVTPDTITDDDLIRLGLSRGQRTALIDLLDLEMPKDLREYWDALSDERRQEARRRGLETIVANATRKGPVLTVIEDLQWAEDSILARIGVLASIVADYPNLLVLTSRIDDDRDDLFWRGQARNAPFTTIDLNPLREKEALALGRSIVDDDDFVLRCYERSGGHPFFMEQLLRTTSESGRLIPASVQAVIETNLYQLPVVDLDAIQAGAVLGYEFSHAALTALIDNEDYEPTLLLHQRLLVKTERGYHFSHALIRECTYNTLLKSRRNALHNKAAYYFIDTSPALRVDHLLLSESEDAPAELLEMARRERSMNRNDRAKILVRKGLTSLADESTRRAFRELESDLQAAHAGWEELGKS